MQLWATEKENIRFIITSHNGRECSLLLAQVRVVRTIFSSSLHCNGHIFYMSILLLCSPCNVISSSLIDKAHILIHHNFVRPYNRALCSCLNYRWISLNWGCLSYTITRYVLQIMYIITSHFYYVTQLNLICVLENAISLSEKRKSVEVIYLFITKIIEWIIRRPKGTKIRPICTNNKHQLTLVLHFLEKSKYFLLNRSYGCRLYLNITIIVIQYYTERACISHQRN